jgi:hypothetical protein
MRVPSDDLAGLALDAAGDAAYEWDLSADAMGWRGKPEDVFGPRVEFPPTGQVFQSRTRRSPRPH